MSKKERDQIKNYFFKEGFIACPEPHRYVVKNKKESFKILYVDNKSEEHLRVTDFSNIISFYKSLCENCGNEMEQRKRRKICDKCYYEHLREIKNISDRKRRSMRKDNYERPCEVK
jgi:protein-arginine kinase activator protein McsA